MTEKESLQGAADAARKAARAARELAGMLDDYAKYLTQPSWRARADDLHHAALNKLSVVNDNLAACNKLVAEGGTETAAQTLKPAVTQEVRAQQQVAAAPRTPTVRVVRKGGQK